VAAVGILAAPAARAQNDRPAIAGGGTQPERDGTPSAEQPEASPDEQITLSDFSEPVELSALVEFVAEELGVNIHSVEGVTGSVVFNAPVTVKRSELLGLLDSLLAQQGFALTWQADTGWYGVVRAADIPLIPSSAGDALATTRIIEIPNVRPSAIQTAIQGQLGTTTARITALDELGVLMVTDTARGVRVIEELIRQILESRAQIKNIIFDLKYLSAPVARQRAIELLGKGGTTPAVSSRDPRAIQAAQQAARQAAALGAGGQMSNLADRLQIYSQGNALLFRGRDDEAEEVRRILTLIDRPDTLVARRYSTRSATGAIARLASALGLGEMVELTEVQGQQTPTQQQLAGRQQALPGAGAQLLQGGSVMVVSYDRGDIVYYGTPEQQDRMADLVKEYGTEGERVVVRGYKLINTNAEQVAELVQALIENQNPAAQGGLLPGGQPQRRRQQPQQQQRRSSFDEPEPDEQRRREGIRIPYSPEIFVYPDTINNQVFIKAPLKVQADFEELIRNVDLRRPQVYIEARIVSVTGTDDARFAVETQLINAAGTGGILQTNFGLTSSADGGTIIDPRAVSTGLTGLTTALIKSDMVPVVIHAMQRVADTRILSVPQLLVGDNETAEIVSVDQQPTTTTNQVAGAPTTTSFGGFEDAGTTLRVTPHISAGGYIRLEYLITLSNFVGQGSNGVPPPRQERTISIPPDGVEGTGAGVTVPTDTTIVVGGITVDQKSSTVAKVPFIGDIPIIGNLFKDTNKNNSKTLLYVFITPRIMRDINFTDLKLLTMGPQGRAEIAPDLPELEPTLIPVLKTPEGSRLEATNNPSGAGDGR